MTSKELSLRLQLGLEDAYKMIEAAFCATGGNAVHSATRLHVGHRTLMRWVGRDKRLKKALDAARRG